MKPVGQEQLQSTYLVEIPSWAEMLEQSLSLCIDVVVCSVFNASSESQWLALVSLITQDAQGLKRFKVPFIPDKLTNMGSEFVLLVSGSSSLSTYCGKIDTCYLELEKEQELSLIVKAT